MIVTLTTDFGLEDPTVAVMKGVMLGIKPDLRIIDVTHKIPPQDITRAAFCVGRFGDYFPKGTAHVVVVDPGVGSKRNGVIIQTQNYFYIGPDNGLFSLLDSDVEKMVKIENPKYMRVPVSATFHGRDIFAPATAHLAGGVPIDEFGPPLEKPEKLKMPEPVLGENGELFGEIRYFDHFGNAFSNITATQLRMMEEKNPKGTLSISVGEGTIHSISSCYQAVPEGKMGAIINSFGFLEFFGPNTNARDKFGLGAGDKVSVRFLPEMR